MAPQAPPVIDFAAHCLVDIPDHVDYSFLDQILGGPIYASIEDYAEYCDGLGIDGAVLSQPYYLGMGDVDAVEGANDTLRAEVADVPNYYALASLPTGAGGPAAAEEFERCLEAGFNGGAIETDALGADVHSADLEPVMAVADRTGAPVFIHPQLDDSIGSPALDDAWMLNGIFGRDAALATSLCKVIHTGLLDRYPNLNLVYHHLGGNIAAALGRVKNQFEKYGPEGWLGEAPEPYKPYDEFRAQLENRIYIDTSGYDGAVAPLRAALGAFPPSQLLFGTDFPFETRTGEDVDAILEPIVAETPHAVGTAILGGNALDLLVNLD